MIEAILIALVIWIVVPVLNVLIFLIAVTPLMCAHALWRALRRVLVEQIDFWHGGKAN